MTLGDIIKQYRAEHGLSMDDFAKASGISKAYISLLEKDKHPQTGKPITPSVKFIKMAARGMGVDFDTLFKRLDGNVTINNIDVETSKPDGRKMQLTEAEKLHIAKYRFIDDRGRSFVDTILDEEYHRAKTGQYGAEVYEDYLYLGKIAAAGTAIYPGDIPLERIRERRLDGADFMVGVCGDSMEPTYFDGDRVYVKKTTDIEFGDIGLFIVNGYYYIKEYAPDGLRSHNPNYSLIPKDREIIVVGKVLGKAEK